MSQPSDGRDRPGFRPPEDKQEVLPPNKSRQGGMGRTAFYILGASLLLVLIAWLLLEIWAYMGTPSP